MLIIADIAGQMDAVQRLVDKVNPKKIILVGDLIDRGPHSAEVVEWAIKDNRVTTILGNHEHMMLDYWRLSQVYDQGIWEMNGGTATMLSYDRYFGSKKPPASHLNFLESRNLFYVHEDLIVTHAAIHEKMNIAQACDLQSNLEESVLWNRGEPRQRERFQVFGHNSHWGLRAFSENENPESVWGLCIDQSRKQVVTGFVWPEKQIVTEPYLRSQNKDGGLNAVL